MLDINKLFNEFFNEPKFELPSIFGELKTETGSDENGDWKKQTYHSKDGLTRIVTYYKSTSLENNELVNFKNELKTAVSNQDYETAITLRDKIKTIESKQTQISELENSLDEAIESENFELAIELRNKIKDLKTK